MYRTNHSLLVVCLFLTAFCAPALNAENLITNYPIVISAPVDYIRNKRETERLRQKLLQQEKDLRLSQRKISYLQEDLETKHQELKSLKSRLGETDRQEKTVTACKLRISELENKIYRERKLADKLKQKGASNSKQSPESESPSPALQEEITNLRNTLRQRNETIGAMRTDLSECNTLLEQAFRPDGKVAEMEKALKEYSRRISSLQEDVTRQQECLEEMEQSRAVDRREIETLTKEIARFRAMNPNNQEKPNRQESDLPKIAPRRIEPLSEQNEKLMGVAQEWSPRVPDSALLITEDKSPLDDSSLSFPQLEMNMRILPARDQ